MDFFSHLFSTLGAIHVNAVITIWGFLRDNIMMIGVIAVMAYLAGKEIKQHDHLFVQDKRRML